uniref:Plastid light harvesting protein n=1 Tax=Pseudo-nitzschia australis TaxID=44445 RepID=A0A7S4AHP8_9STRA|mmetsp:Transcript_27564/g.60672  ORF Transcript_27564/g.60672 Transcript_27564/m.60672 type:complete len:200 (-) Transcript_27564:248-847(-)|eukprot:CAMPEP_0168175168 /NCGR_PEP_ID=MMETSP0139_2-20121125/6958_1 /TAXON_ID=44445 /ORGANISM="Pseudo-nitzschia australis, Strain 10249 10 AB" /LENGTH=199 /DNA_ID=CAMNT_0008093497 /DNA_START=51 /DNA_END=650 /DNA_ORIENTATION=-
MKTSILLATMLVSASAFTAPNTQSSSSSTLMAASDDFGAMAPLGYFDPLGLTKDDNQEYLDHLREVEIRHGRCAMLAVVGWLVTASGARLPGMEEMPYGFKALTAVQDLPAEIRGTLPLTLGCVWALTFAMQDLTGTSEFPGDYRNGFIDFGWDKYDDEWKTKKRTVELNNGRAAQMGILGIMVHEQLGNLNEIGLPQP